MESTLTSSAVACGVNTLPLAPEDFDAIVRQHQKRIYRILLLLLRDPDAADTLTQECFLRAFVKRNSFRGTASLATWLTRIAINLAYDNSSNRRMAFWRRLLYRAELSEAAPADHHSSPEQALLAREAVATVWSAAGSLPLQQRTAFMLRFAEEMPLGQIAEVMNLEIGTVKSHLARALAAVRRSVRRDP